MKCVVIYNPFAKKGKIKDNKQLIKDTLLQKFEEVDFLESEYNNHTSELAASACGVYDVIVAAGGDGTFNEVVNGIAEKENKPMVAFLPCGTVNDVARSLGIPKNIEGALQVILGGKAFKHDIFKANDRYGVYVLTAGLFSRSTYITDQEKKRKFGWLAYFAQGFKDLFRPNNIRIKITCDNNDSIEDNFAFIMLANSNSVAGFHVNENATLNDGLVDVVLIKQSRILSLTNLFSGLRLVKLFLFRIRSLKNDVRVTHVEAKNVSIKNYSDAEFNMDGELGGKGDIEFKMLKEEILVFVPDNQDSTKNHLIKVFN
jgi:diacylglycerol kinase (ATP)